MNGDWWVRGHVPIADLEDYGLHLPVDSDAYNSVGGYVFGELGRLPKRGDMVRPTATRSASSPCGENRIEAVRIRDHKARSAARDAPRTGGGGRGHAASSQEPAEGRLAWRADPSADWG